MRTLAVIPARAGSRGIPGKNRRLFMGRPLAAWAIEVGKATCDEVFVTTDDPTVAWMANEAGIRTINRPPELARDDTPMIDVLSHILTCEPDNVDCLVLLQPTQPLRTVAHIQSALRIAEAAPFWDSVVSVCRIPAHFSPEWSAKIIDGTLRYSSKMPTRRQECEPSYYRDGTVYVVKPAWITARRMYGRRSLPLLIPEHESCTLDTEDDWAQAERMWRAQHV
jgi:CMP-N,N'-diacetyllegionaminic acid synthase